MFEIAVEEKAEMRSALTGLTDEVLSRLLRQDIPELQRLYFMPGNPINYVTTVLEGLARAENFVGEEKDSVRRSARYEAVQNMYTAAVEHVIADSIGRFDYRLEWESGSNIDQHGISSTLQDRTSTQSSRLKGQFGYLDELTANAINNDSGQIPAFEIPRNEADMRILQELTALRGSFPSRQSLSPLVKFSPTPDIRFKDVQSRGYVGHDQITVFTPVVDQRGKLVGENVEVVWLPSLSADKYHELAVELAQLGNTKALEFLQKTPGELEQTVQQHGSQDHFSQEERTQEELALDVIDMSGALSIDQFAALKKFCNQKSLAASEQRKRQKPLIDDYLASARPQIARKGLDLIDQTLTCLADQQEEATRYLLSQIMELIADQQFDMRLFLLNELEQDTFSAEVKQGILQAQAAQQLQIRNPRINYEHEWDPSGMKAWGIDTHAIDMRQLRIQSGYVAAGCGYKAGVGGDFTNNSILAGLAVGTGDWFSRAAATGGSLPMGWVDVDGEGFGEKSCYNCDTCGVRTIIDANNSKFAAFCIGCGTDARCN